MRTLLVAILVAFAPLIWGAASMLCEWIEYHARFGWPEEND